jgi:cytochrome c-type biogenesis protein CcsB
MRQKIKKSIITLYVTIIIVMAGATFIEYSKGTQFASNHIYSSWWFCAIWATLAISTITYIIKIRMHSVTLLLLHTSFIIILAGALITHLYAIKGQIHLRKGITTNLYTVNSGKEIKSLPFKICLKGFNIIYNNGTSAAKDYVSYITITKDEDSKDGYISMNNIFTYESVRFYQTSYDNDGNGTYLTINSDPYGIAISYTGYALLFFSLIWLLIDPYGSYRKLLKSPLLKKGMLCIIFLGVFSSGALATPVLPNISANKFGKLDIMYNNRICPIQTFAIDFTKKLYGSSSYNDYSAEQVLTGFIFWNKEWNDEPIIRIKDNTFRKDFGLPKYISINQLFNKNFGGYILGPAVQEYYQGNHDRQHKTIMEIDDKVQLIMSLRHGNPFKIFPYGTNNNITWYSPKAKFPKYIDKNKSLFIRNIFTFLNQCAHTNNYNQFNSLIAKIRIYQEQNGGNTLPTVTQIISELIYNKIPFANILSIINITMGFITLFYYVYRLSGNRARRHTANKIISYTSMGIMLLSFISLTYCEILRWIISNTIPMTNGYETMILLAWFAMLFSLILYHKFRILITFGFLMSGFFLLVSYFGQMDPQITPIMPVLSSPLLSIHVSIIMMSFSLLSLTFICGLTALILYCTHKIHHDEKTIIDNQLSSLCLLSKVLLYPAITTLGIGIFIGAIWANISWGQYWSWDPKEVWALITFMFYAIVLHKKSLPIFNNPLHYHIYTTIAFAMILMTYFGVNYFLGGMHSYA